MNQKQLQYFLEIYRMGSISKAAQALYITPQGISKTLISLENELGVKLFRRDGRRMVPTKAGLNLVSHAQTILNEFHAIESRRFLAVSPRTSVRVACSYDVPEFLPGNFFYQFYEDHPEILPQLHEMPDVDAMEHLDEQRVDLAILPGPLDSVRFQYRYLYTNHFVLMINRKNPKSSCEVLQIEDVQDEVMIIKGFDHPLSKLQLNEYFRRKTIPNNMLETSSFTQMKQIVHDNRAIAMTLDYKARGIDDPEIAVVPYAPDVLRKDLYLVESASSQPRPEAAAFAKALKSFF